MKINSKLKQYIEDNIFPQYSLNDKAHDLSHIKYVIERSLKFADLVCGIDYDMVYTIAVYHDIGHHIDAKNHEKVSADILMADEKLREFFDEEQIKIMFEAICDHRASLDGEPRSIYGKIVSSADRNVLIDILIRRVYAYRLEHYPNWSLDEKIEDSRQYIISKFGSEGYATKKIFFKDRDYEKFLNDISVLAKDREKFTKKYMEVIRMNIDEVNDTY